MQHHRHGDQQHQVADIALRFLKGPCKGRQVHLESRGDKRHGQGGGHQQQGFGDAEPEPDA